MKTFSLKKRTFCKKVDLLLKKVVLSHLPHLPSYGPVTTYCTYMLPVIRPGCAACVAPDFSHSANNQKFP